MGSVPPDSKIATVDLTELLESEDASVRKKKADELVEALRVHGTCGVIGHGISVERLRSAFHWTRKFFDLPIEEKLKANHPDGIVPHRGYSGFGREKCLVYTEEELEKMEGELSTDFKKPLDWKEHIDIGSEEEKRHHNLWIDEAALPGFRSFTTTFFWELERLSSAVLDALCLSLEIDEETFKYLKSIHNGQQNGLRLIHYPAAIESTIDRSSTTWCPAHTDFTTFTLLFQDENQGLEIEDRLNPGTYFPATTEIEDRCYLTIGDFGEIWTNGYLPASKHRVMIPRPPDGRRLTTKRYSMPYFITPEHHGIMGPIKSGKPATMSEGKHKTCTIQEHIEFRMKFQY